MNRKHKYFPLFVSLEEKEILVVGGGTIASRRIRALLPFGGRLTVIAPEVSDFIKEAAAEGMSGHCFLNHEGRPLLLKKVCPELDRILKDLSENPPSAES